MPKGTPKRQTEKWRNANRYATRARSQLPSPGISTAFAKDIHKRSNNILPPKKEIDLRNECIRKQIEIKNSCAPPSVTERHYPKSFFITKKGEEE